jgi:hypothetical protein
MEGTPAAQERNAPAQTILGFPAAAWLAGLLALAVATVLYASRDLVFLSDELTWLSAFEGYGLANLLTPHNGHLIVLFRLLYEGLPDTFGGSYLPFRVLSAAALAGAGACFYLFARPRVPPAVALCLTALALFMGSAEVVSVSPLGLATLLSISFGLAAIVAADRGHDGVGCVALILAIAAHTPGVLIGAGLLLYVLMVRRTPKAIAAYGIPLVLYGIWWLWALRFDQSLASADNIPGVPGFMAESATAVAGAVAGITPLANNPIAFVERALPLAAVPVVAGALALAFWLWRKQAIGPWAICLASMLLAFWGSAGLAESAVRQPTTPRLVAFGAVFVLLLAVAILERVELPRGGWIAAGALAAFAVMGNVVGFVRGVDEVDAWAAQARVQLGALELAGENADPAFNPGSVTTGAGRLPLNAGELAVLRAEYGVGEGFVDELATAPPELRNEADAVLVLGLGLQTTPTTGVASGLVGCAVGEVAEVTPGRIRLRAVGDTNVALSRFGATPVPVGFVEGGTQAEFVIPEDGGGGSWTLTASRPIRVCQ